MTTHGRSGLSRLVLGSMADRLVRAGVPMLLIPPLALPGEQGEQQTEPSTAPTGGR